jgi:hypothetical protein
MTFLRAAARTGLAVALALSLGGPAPRAAAQAPPAPEAAVPHPEGSPDPTIPDPTRPHKSVYGKLSVIDKTLNGVAMTTDSGERLAWRFNPSVVKEAAQFKPGDRMIVIYRQIASNEKRVTALAFPGSAKTPIYVNTTGQRVLVRSTAAVDGVCGGPGEGKVTESVIPAGGIAEVLDGCWCCATDGESCTPGNKSGNGRALLVHCFQ